MTDQTMLPADENDLRAAEYVLRLLDPEAHAETEALVAADPDFAAAVARWELALAPLLNGVPEAAPAPELWQRIESKIGIASETAGNVLRFEPRARLWKTYSAAMTAIAAALAVALLLDGDAAPPAPVPVAQVPAPTMVAMLESPDNPARLVVSFDPATRSVLVAPAVLSGDPDHQHELWLIPADGTPRSLGLVGVDGAQRIVIPVALLRDLSADASIALSIEPVGGSPTGLPTGPVIASGKLSTI